MLCASEILLRIYVIINCIKQISILLDTEAAFGFHLGTSDAVTFAPRPYHGSYCPTVTVDSRTGKLLAKHTTSCLTAVDHTDMLYYLVFRFQGVFLPFLIYSDTYHILVEVLTFKRANFVFHRHATFSPPWKYIFFVYLCMTDWMVIFLILKWINKIGRIVSLK